ncbi:MAG: DNA polymerase III subunit gamma/tau [Christensenellaceae bacterium]|nr:DNA polymerase III subunit gamma/tau [Christensenellaceae bacterium]
MNQIKSLYRKYRPKYFYEVIGQEHVTKTLSNQIKNNNIGHAYLFCGSRGTGKTSVAKIFANAVNCYNFNNEVCGECEWCQNLNKNLDVIEIDAASNNGVEPVRDLINAIQFPPINGKYKVYIIDEIHMFSNSAFNALLKTLEEPPSHVIFILATTEEHKLPATIKSRCLKFDFRLISQQNLELHVKNILSHENITCEPNVVQQIAKYGRGSLRDALSFTDMLLSFCNTNKITLKDVRSVSGNIDETQLYQLLKNIHDGNLQEIHKICGEISNVCNNYNILLENMIEIIKNDLINKKSSKNIFALKKFIELYLLIRHSNNVPEFFEATCLLAASND